ncbi:MAG TPA: bifunctional precorrin-2 dehydrogenase/sirohydrochlorin ferrochelatase [Longimicrobiaceae bacterium]|nr:bifunctional precorrin-2 dehydrogenase/sirohydrochlorin ferrochelatase [Longimicrobiaceae bacterium]
MSGLYPALLDVRRLRVLVVGGGAVALRKVRGVVAAGGSPVVIAPAVLDELRALIGSVPLVWHAREYAPGDAAGCRLVFAATGSAAVNAAVAREAEAAGALVAVADDGPGSTLHTPSSVRQGGVVVAFSTGGASPLLARRLRERLEAVVTPGLGRAARRLERARAQVRARWPGDAPRRRAAWFQLVTPEFLDAAIAGRDDDVESRISQCLSQS